MNVKEAVLSRRTKRKFLKKPVEKEKLVSIIDHARFTPFGANLQPLKYMIIDEPKLVESVFSFTKWSGYHPEDAPSKNEMPPSYIVMLGDKSIKQNGEFETEAGAAGAVISLLAEEEGLSSCWLGAINRPEISKLLGLCENMSLLYLIAVGYSDQKSRAVLENGDIKYFTDTDNVLNVPKRKLSDILINI